jgi:hypothetical protein
MARGGPRPNSGRKPGVSKATLLKRRIQDYFNEDEVAKLVELAKRQARTRPELMKFLLEQIFGKAPQRVEMTGKDGQALFLPSEILIKNRLSDSHPGAEGDRS